MRLKRGFLVRVPLMLALLSVTVFAVNAMAGCGGGGGGAGGASPGSSKWAEEKASDAVREAINMGRKLVKVGEDLAAEAGKAGIQTAASTPSGFVNAAGTANTSAVTAASGNVAVQGTVAAVAGAPQAPNGTAGEAVAAKARDFLDLAKKFEAMAAIAYEKLATIRSSVSSPINVTPVDMHQDRLDRISEKAKAYKEQAQALAS